MGLRIKRLPQVVYKDIINISRYTIKFQQWRLLRLQHRRNKNVGKSRGARESLATRNYFFFKYTLFMYTIRQQNEPWKDFKTQHAFLVYNSSQSKNAQLWSCKSQNAFNSSERFLESWKVAWTFTFVNFVTLTVLMTSNANHPLKVEVATGSLWIWEIRLFLISYLSSRVCWPTVALIHRFPLLARTQQNVFF